MERLALDAVPRQRAGKGGLKRLRGEDRIPAVIYGRGKESEALVVEGKTLRQVLATGGANVLVDLRIRDKEQGKKGKDETVMLKDIQRDILHADRITHVDFIRISMTEQIEVSVPLIFTGEPAGVREGGVLQPVLREISVRCLPAAIPEAVEVDLSHLEAGGSITAGEITLNQKVELLTAPDETVALILAPAAEAKPEAGEEAAEGESPETEES